MTGLAAFPEHSLKLLIKGLGLSDAIRYST